MRSHGLARPPGHTSQQITHLSMPHAVPLSMPLCTWKLPSCDACFCNPSNMLAEHLACQPRDQRPAAAAALAAELPPSLPPPAAEPPAAPPSPAADPAADAPPSPAPAAEAALAAACSPIPNACPSRAKRIQDHQTLPRAQVQTLHVPNFGSKLCTVPETAGYQGLFRPGKFFKRAALHP